MEHFPKGRERAGDSMIRKIFSVASRKGKVYIFMATVAFTIGGLLSAYLIYLMVSAMSNIDSFTNTQGVLNFTLLLSGLVVAKMITAVIADLAKHFAGFDVEMRLRESIVRKLKQFSLGFYSNERLGEVSTIIHKDVQNLESVVGHFASVMVSDILIALAVGIFLFILSWQIWLAMISLLPVALLLLIFGYRKDMNMQKNTANAGADMVSSFVEYTKGVSLLRSYASNTTFEDRLKDSVERFGECARIQSKHTAGYVGRFNVPYELAYAVMVVIGALMVATEAVSVYTFLLFVILSREFYKPFKKAEGYWMDYITVKDSYQRVDKLYQTPVIPGTTSPKTPAQYDVRFENVCFAYEQDEFSLKDINFHLTQGTFIALVGPSGSGKTTITNLLLRFWDIEQGSIQIGGVDIRDMDYDMLLRDVSIVMQNVVLLSGSIADNIRIGKANATDEEVIAAAQKAQIHDFISGLPDGYNAQIGENGVGLSGGQRQRISIARAFLKDAPILLLDEMTSNVDPVNEVKIQRAVNALVEGRTVIAIAHHLHTIQGADRILVFDNGTLCEQGSHDELLCSGGLYSNLWDVQERSRAWKITQ